MKMRERKTVLTNDMELVGRGATQYQILGSQYFRRLPDGSDLDLSAIDMELVEESVKQYKDDTRPLILDIEAFDLYADREKAIENMVPVLEAWKDTGRRVGWYGVIPDQSQYWDYADFMASPSPGTTLRHELQQTRNNANYFDFRGDWCDFFCPSMYAIYSPSDPQHGAWQYFARGVVQEARRLAGDRPVYPFIWPMRHPSLHSNEAIPLAEWNRMVRFVESLPCDGMVVWQEQTDTPDEKWRDVFRRML